LTKITPFPKSETPPLKSENSPVKQSENLLQLKKEKSNTEEKKKEKSTNAWGEAKYGKNDDEDNKHFGLLGMYKFTWPRIWRGSCWMKFIVIMNFVVIMSLKITAVFIPLLLKEVIDAITCDNSKYFTKTFDAD